MNTEEALKGSPVNEKLYQAIEDKVREEIHPRDSWRASREFRLQIGGEIARRALERTVELAAGGEREMKRERVLVQCTVNGKDVAEYVDPGRISPGDAAEPAGPYFCEERL